MFSKESTKCVSMKLCFQTKKNQMVLNERQEINIHSLSLKKTHDISQKAFTLKKYKLAVAQNKINLHVQILTAFVDPHFLNISGILSLDCIIYKNHKIPYSHNREAFYDWYRCFNLRSNFLCQFSNFISGYTTYLQSQKKLLQLTSCLVVSYCSQ